MLSTEIILTNFAQDVVDGIAANIADKEVTPFGPMRATGLSMNSIMFQFDQGAMELVIKVTGKAAEYFDKLESGTPPGERPSIKDLYEWTIVKGITPPAKEYKRGERAGQPYPEDVQRRSLAYAIAHKISEEGSLLYRQGGNSGIISDWINADRLTMLKRELLFSIVESFKSQVIDIRNGILT